MRNIILALLISFPLFTIAQNKGQKPDFHHKHYNYLIMTYNDQAQVIKSPKKNKTGVRKSKNLKTNYSFVVNDQRLAFDLSKLSTSFSDEISALNALGKMGWELVGIKGSKYYFKSNRIK